MNKRTILLSLTSASAALGVVSFIAVGAAFASPSADADSSSGTAAVTATVIPLGTPVPTTVVNVTPTHFISASRPALAISNYFTVPVTQVLVLRSEGWGYGEIFKLYRLSLVSGKTVTDVKVLRDSGLGWGNVAKQLGVHPGNAGFNLGAVMSERDMIALTMQPTASALSAANVAKPGKANPAANNNGNQGNGGNPNRGKPDDKGKPEDRGNPGNGGNNKEDKGNKKNK